MYLAKHVEHGSVTYIYAVGHNIDEVLRPEDDGLKKLAVILSESPSMLLDYRHQLEERFLQNELNQAQVSIWFVHTANYPVNDVADTFVRQIKHYVRGANIPLPPVPNDKGINRSVMESVLADGNTVLSEIRAANPRHFYKAPSEELWGQVNMHRPIKADVDSDVVLVNSDREQNLHLVYSRAATAKMEAHEPGIRAMCSWYVDNYGIPAGSSEHLGDEFVVSNHGM